MQENVKACAALCTGLHTTRHHSDVCVFVTGPSFWVGTAADTHAELDRRRHSSWGPGDPSICGSLCCKDTIVYKSALMCRVFS
jgi:hypothetical protein